MCNSPAGNVEAEVNGNNKSVEEYRIWKTRESEEEENKQQPDSEWQATAQGCLPWAAQIL